MTSGHAGSVMTADELRTANRRLDTALLELAAAADPALLHTGPAGEWSLAQVLAHLGEFPSFFADHLRRWRTDPDAVVGRTHDHPVRLAAVDDPLGQLEELVAAARRAFAELAAELETLNDDDLDAATNNVKYGIEPLTAFLDRYVVGHKTGHLEQIRALLQPGS